MAKEFPIIGKTKEGETVIIDRAGDDADCLLVARIYQKNGWIQTKLCTPDDFETTLQESSF